MPDQFTKKSILQLKAKIEGVYLPVFETLLVDGSTEEGRAIRKLLQLVDRLQKVLDDILRKGVTIATVSDAQVILNLTEQIEAGKDAVIPLIANERLQKANDELGLTSEDLKISKQYVKERAESAQQQSSKPTSGGGSHFDYGPAGSILRTLGISSGKRAIALGVASQVAIPALGPYAPAAALGLLGLRALRPSNILAGIRGTARGVRGAYRGAKAIGSAVRHPFEAVKGAGRGIKSGIASMFGQMHPDYDPSSVTSGGSYSSTRGEGTSSGLGTSGKKAAAAPLLYFFDKQWKKATWTKDIHGFLKDMSGDTTQAGGGFLTKALAVLGVITTAVVITGESLKAERKRQNIAGENLALSSRQMQYRVNRFGLEKTAEKMGITPEELQQRIDSGKKQAEIIQKEANQSLIIDAMGLDNPYSLSNLSPVMFGINLFRLFRAYRRKKLAIETYAEKDLITKAEADFRSPLLQEKLKEPGVAELVVMRKKSQSIQPYAEKEEKVPLNGRKVTREEYQNAKDRYDEKQQETLEKIEQNTKKEEISPLFNFDNFIDSLDDLKKVGVMK